MRPPLRKVSSLRLRSILPDLALKLETEYLLDQGHKLGIKIYKAIKGKSAELSVMLIERGFEHKDSVIVRISPVIKGPFGYREWFWFQDPEVKVSRSKIVGKVQFFDISRGTPQKLLVSNIDGQGLNQFLYIAIQELEIHTGRRFSFSKKDNPNV